MKSIRFDHQTKDQMPLNCPLDPIKTPLNAIKPPENPIENHVFVAISLIFVMV